MLQEEATAREWEMGCIYYLLKLQSFKKNDLSFILLALGLRSWKSVIVIEVTGRAGSYASKALGTHHLSQRY